MRDDGESVHDGGFVHRLLTASSPRLAAAAMLIGYIVLALLDRSVYDWLGDRASRRGVDWREFMRVLGYLPLWAAAALAITLHDRPWTHRPLRRGRSWRGPALFIAAAGSGLAAEAVKVVIGRERPRVTDGAYAFRPFFERLDPPSLGLPSSHVAVAAGGALMMAMIWPRTWPVALAVIAACAWNRVADAGAHFASDAGAAAAVAYLIARITYRYLIAPRGVGAAHDPAPAT